MLEVKDRVNILNADGDVIGKGMIYNINEFRPPNMTYAVDVDEYDDDLLFFGENQLVKINNLKDEVEDDE